MPWWEEVWVCARLYRRINQLEPLLEQAHREPIEDVPTVVQWDDIWLTLQTQNETEKRDSRKRRSKERTSKRVVVLVALEFWNDRTGRRKILDWEMASSENQPSWEKLVQVGGGGLGGALVLVSGSSVLDQRCLFHKLRNVADKCREDLKGEAKKEQRKQLLEQATEIYQAESAFQAYLRVIVWATTWREQAPKAVATLERDFEQTLAFYTLEGIPREWIRTTSLLERTNRELRRKFRQAVRYSSQTGAQVAIFLQVQRLHAQWSR